MKTPQHRWNTNITKYRNQCKKIIAISSSIRYTGVINEYGRTLTGILKPTIKPYLKSDQIKNEFFIIATLTGLRKDSTSSIGKLDYITIRHQKLTILILQKNKITYYTSIENKDKDIKKIIEKIKKIISKLE